MSRQIVINHTLQPEMLDSGQQLAAAGTKGSERDDVTLSEGDYERLVKRGKVSVVIVEETPASEQDSSLDAPAQMVRPRAPRAAPR